MDDIRDRLARAEQDIKNQKENFLSFKADDFGALKREVHTMRGEINEKLDALHERIADQDAKITKLVIIVTLLAQSAGQVLGPVIKAALGS